MSASLAKRRQPARPRRKSRAAVGVEPGCIFELTSDSLHDLASPLNQLSSVADLILSKYGSSLDGEAHVLFGFMKTATHRLQNLLGGLSIYAQMAGTPPEIRRCNGDAVLDAALANIAPAISSTNAVVTHDPLPEIDCDPGQLSSMFSHLIDNSIKFRGDSQPVIHICVIPKKRAWVFGVRDNGIGIDPKYGKRIFGAFKRVHNDAYPGAGVGLAIARHIVESHRGRIWVESELGKGATFFISLPRLEEQGTKTTDADPAVHAGESVEIPDQGPGSSDLI